MWVSVATCNNNNHHLGLASWLALLPPQLLLLLGFLKKICLSQKLIHSLVLLLLIYSLSCTTFDDDHALTNIKDE
jgi:hypothetical protein